MRQHVVHVCGYGTSQQSAQGRHGDRITVVQVGCASHITVVHAHKARVGNVPGAVHEGGRGAGHAVWWLARWLARTLGLGDGSIGSITLGDI
jgi:hypothetical protein